METHPQSIVSGISLSTQMCFVLFFCYDLQLFSDLVPDWFGLHHWPEENSSLLLPEAKAESLIFFPGWCGFSGTPMATHRHACGELWLCASV